MADSTSTTERLPLQEALDNATGLKPETVDEVLNEVGITPEAGMAEPSDEQKHRMSHKLKGLRGRALARWILTGEGSREQVANGGNGKGSKAAEERLAEQAERSPGQLRPGSMTSAMVEVLTGKRKAMSAKDIWAEIKAKNLAPNLKGKTPDATIGAKLATEAKKSDGLFERIEPGKFRLRK